MSLYDYRIALGSNVALVSLSNIEDVLKPYCNGLSLPPSSQPLNLYPVRTVMLSGKPRGDGRVDVSWTWQALPSAAVRYMFQTWFSSGSVVSTAVTIYTRRHELGTYARYNANMELFIPGDTYTYDRGKFRNVQLRFYKLIASSS